MNVQTVTEEKKLVSLMLKQPSGDLANETKSQEETPDITDNDDVANVRKDPIKTSTEKQTSTQSAENIKDGDIPCIPQETSEKKEANVRKVKRNKNEKPGTLAGHCGQASVVLVGRVDTSSLATQISVLEIDGPEVDSPLPVAHRSGSAYSFPPGAMASSSVFTDSLGSTESSVALSASSSNDKLEYGDLSASSMPSDSSLSGLIAKPAKVKDDFVIIFTEEDEDEAFKYKCHLKTDILHKDETIPAIKVQLFGSYKFGQSKFASLDTLLNDFNHVLVYATENLCKSHVTRFTNEIIITFNLEKGENCNLTPVWPTKERLPIPELKVLPGLPYWRFTTNSSPDTYIDRVKTLLNQVR